MKRIVVIATGLASMICVAGCDNTYTPGMHHQDSASTGSMLSGTDTGANTGNSDNPSITSNLGNGSAAYGH